MRGQDGNLYKVAAKDAHAAFEQGGAVVPHEELRKAELDEKYGGVGQTLRTGAEGLARGLTVGLSDPLAVSAAGLVGGKKGADELRQEMAERKETHPWIAGGTEVAGAIIPTIASGGSAGPAEAANIARTGVGLAEAGAEGARALSATEKMGALLRAVGAPARGVAAAGEGAGGLAERTLSLVMGTPGADGALARITRQAVSSGARGATEGALFGAGQEISEDALGDHQLNAEKLVAALGHGALYGGLLGGGLGAAGGVARETFASVMNKVAPALERQADLQMWKALNPLKKFTNEAEARAGGANAVGRTLREELDLGTNPLKAALNAEELAPKIDEAVDRKWGQMSELMKATGGEVKGGAVVDAVDDVIAPLRKKAGFEGVVSTLEQYKASLASKLGLVADVSDEGIANMRLAALRNATGAEERLGAAGMDATDAFDAMREKAVPVADVMAQRKALDELVYKETRALDPNMRVEALRAVRGKLADLELEAFDSAAKSAGKQGVGEELRGLRKDYQRLRIAQDAVNDTSSRMATNNTLSLTDNMAGAAHMAGALAAGHPGIALGGYATAYAHKLVRERGNAAAAVALGRLAKMDLIARAAQRVDGEIDGAIASFVKGGERPPARVRLRHFQGPAPANDIDDRYKRAEASHVAQPTTITAEHVQKALPGLADAAPKHAGALAQIVNAGAAALAASRPVPTSRPDVMGRPGRVPEFAQAKYLREQAAVDDPVGTIVDGLETGKLHKDQIDIIKKTKPKLYADIQQKTAAAIAKHGDKDLNFQRKQTASLVLGYPLDPSMGASMVKQSQAIYAQQAAGGGQGGGGAPHAPKRQLKGVASNVGLSVGRTSGP